MHQVDDTALDICRFPYRRNGKRNICCHDEKHCHICSQTECLPHIMFTV